MQLRFLLINKKNEYKPNGRWVFSRQSVSANFFKDIHTGFHLI